MTSSFHPLPDPDSPSISVTSPADVLSYVPHALGFTPVESLVVLTTAGRRLGATLRVDLPPTGSKPLAFAEGVLSFLQGDSEADGVLLAVYTTEDWPPLTAPPRNALVLTIEAVLGAAGLPVRAGWLVSGETWRDYFCRDGECCPWPGQPFDAVVHSPLNAELIFGGSAFDASALDAVLRTAPGVRRRIPMAGIDAVEDAQALYAARCSQRWILPSQFRVTAALWDSVLEQPGVLDPAEEPEVVGFLLASVESRTVRDFLLVSACLGSSAALGGAIACAVVGDGAAVSPGPQDEPAVVALVLPEVHGDSRLRSAVARMADTGSVPVGELPPARVPDLVYADVLAGRYTGTIDWSRVDVMTNILARLAAVSAGESRAAVLTMSAWFEYARGRGSRAAVFLDAAQAEVPGYRLARLLHELVRRGGLPAWARNRSTAWTRRAPVPPSSWVA
jgi:hypothetical protein